MTADVIELNLNYKIESVDGIFSQRLIEMGCVPGTEIVKVLKAPLGDPVAYLIGSSFVLAMRKCEAECIIVKENLVN